MCPPSLVCESRAPCPTHSFNRRTTPCPTHSFNRRTTPCPTHSFNRRTTPCPTHSFSTTEADTHTHTHTTTQWSRHATNAGFYMVNVLPHRRSLLICAHVAVRRRHLTHPQDRVTRRSAPPRAARMDRPSPESGSRCASCTRRHPHCAPPRGRGRRLSPRACSISGVVQG